MNTPNPLVPQGSLPSRGKSTVRIAFFTIAAIHVVFIGGLLMQGCKKPEDKPLTEETNTPSAYPPMTTDVAVADSQLTNSAAQPTIASNPPVQQPLQEPTPQPSMPPESNREYVVAKGDSFSSIAKKAGVSVKAVQEANPGVNSTKLKVGQKLQLPASGNGASPAPSTFSAPADNGDTTTYVVKAGDMLEKIARRNGTTVKEIMRMNGLKNTMIKPGQKLKLPAAKQSNGAPVAGSNYVTPLPSTP